MPLTELVHYFNKRNRLVCSAEGEDCFQIVDGQARARFRGNVLTTLFQPVVERASGQVIGHEAHLRAVAGEWVGGPAQGVFLEARDDNELVYLDRLVRTLHALNFLQEREQHGGFHGVGLSFVAMAALAASASGFQ